MQMDNRQRAVSVCQIHRANPSSLTSLFGTIASRIEIRWNALSGMKSLIDISYVRIHHSIFFVRLPVSRPRFRSVFNAFISWFGLVYHKARNQNNQSAAATNCNCGKLVEENWIRVFDVWKLCQMSKWMIKTTFCFVLLEFLCCKSSQNNVSSVFSAIMLNPESVRL